MPREIKVFINPSCSPCNELKKWLNKKNISFVERDVVNEQEAINEFTRIDGQYTPTTLITDGEDKFEIIGYNPAKIDRILSLTE